MSTHDRLSILDRLLRHLQDLLWLSWSIHLYPFGQLGYAMRLGWTDRASRLVSNSANASRHSEVAFCWKTISLILIRIRFRFKLVSENHSAKIQFESWKMEIIISLKNLSLALVVDSAHFFEGVLQVCNHGLSGAPEVFHNTMPNLLMVNVPLGEQCPHHSA